MCQVLSAMSRAGTNAPPQPSTREHVAIGGMPEAVQVYSESKSPLDVVPVYESLLTGFLDDVYKYSTTAKAPYRTLRPLVGLPTTIRIIHTIRGF